MKLLSNKKHQYKYNAIISTIIVAGIIVVIGMISSKLFIRLDLTSGKQFSISKTTIETMKNLDDIVNIKAYFSEKMPSEFLSVKQDVQDILDEYKNYSSGKLRVEMIDPKDDENLQKEARNYGIPELQFSNIEKDKYEVSKGYLGLVILHSSNKEVIPAIKDVNNLEYDLTSAIKKAARTEPARVRFLTGHGELNQEEASILFGELGKIYEVSTIDISNGSLIPDNIKTVVIAGPKEKFSARDKYVIDQFLMNGGNLLVANNGVKIGDGLMASENSTGLEELMLSYGITLNRNLVVDPSCETAQFTSGYTTFITPYPFWPRIGENGFNQESAITLDLDALILPWTSSIGIDETRLAGSKIDRLAMSSAKSWLMENSFNVSPDSPLEQGEQKQSILAVSVSGKLESFFKDKGIPEKPKKEENSEDEFLSSEEEKENDKKTEISNGRIIAVGNAEFIKDNFIKRFPYNMAFFQNALDSLAMDEALMSIRAKTASSSPLNNDISDSAKSAAKFLNIFLVSVLLASAGIARWVIRKKSSDF